MDLFQHYETEKLVEFMFLATRPEYGRRGIRYELAKAIWKLWVESHERFQGLDVATCIITTYIFASFKKNFGFEILSECFYDKMEYDGVKLSDIIDNELKYCAVICKKLEKKKLPNCSL